MTTPHLGLLIITGTLLEKEKLACVTEVQTEGTPWPVRAGASCHGRYPSACQEARVQRQRWGAELTAETTAFSEDNKWGGLCNNTSPRKVF